jgi:hypothetical protein
VGNKKLQKREEEKGQKSSKQNFKDLYKYKNIQINTSCLIFLLSPHPLSKAGLSQRLEEPLV